MNVTPEFLADLECSVCRDVMRPPIRMCVLGHSFCNNCCKMLPQCAVCRSRIGIARNYSLEKVHDNLMLPCKNSEDCTFEALGHRLKEHEKFCFFSQKRCLLKTIDGCTWTGETKDFVQHALSQHPHNVFQTNTQKFLWQDFMVSSNERRIHQFSVIFNAYEKLFKCVWDIHLQQGFVRWFVMIMATKQEAIDFNYSVNVLNGRNRPETMQLQGTCQPYSSRLFRDGSFHINHVETIGRFCDADGRLQFRITIEKAVPAEAAAVEGGGDCARPRSSAFLDSRDPALDRIRAWLVEMEESGTETEDDLDYDGYGGNY